MFLMVILIGTVVLIAISIGLGLLLMQPEQAPHRPGHHLSTPEPASAANHPPFSELSWPRPLWAPWPLTPGKAILLMVIGLLGMSNLILSLVFLIWLEVPLGPCSFLFPVGGGVLFFLGVRDWQRIKALETQGQLAQGVIFDSWVTGRGRTLFPSYNVAYYFTLPWGSPDGSRVIRAENNRQVYQTFQIGDTIPVRYLPDKPQICRVER